MTKLYFHLIRYCTDIPYGRCSRSCLWPPTGSSCNFASVCFLWSRVRILPAVHSCPCLFSEPIQITDSQFEYRTLPVKHASVFVFHSKHKLFCAVYFPSEQFCENVSSPYFSGSTFQHDSTIFDFIYHQMELAAYVLGTLVQSVCLSNCHAPLIVNLHLACFAMLHKSCL